ncbi:hypothetical protein J6590_090603 [Homalodisca vitripennis]|nr:hypothetical protein J6590_090603 [Homalodisca vitripennis]
MESCVCGGAGWPGPLGVEGTLTTSAYVSKLETRLPPNGKTEFPVGSSRRRQVGGWDGYCWDHWCQLSTPRSAFRVKEMFDPSLDRRAALRLAGTRHQLRFQGRSSHSPVQRCDGRGCHL